MDSDSPNQHIHTKLTELHSDISNLPDLPPDSTPGTVNKRQELFKFLDDNITALVTEIDQARPSAGPIGDVDVQSLEPDDERDDNGDDNDNEQEDPKGVEQRLTSIVTALDGDDGPLKAHMFRDSLLAYPGPGTPKDIEDRVFLQLVRGYDDDEQHWADKLKHLIEECTTWDTFCDRGLSNQCSIKDKYEQLIAIQRLLKAQEKTGCMELWVTSVIRMVELIRFNKIWKRHDKGPGSRSWKSKYLNAGCRDENGELYRRYDQAVGAHKELLNKEVKERYGQFKRQTQRRIKSCESLVKLYNLFRAAVFMDRVWDPQDGTSVRRRSGAFVKIVRRVCDRE
ncbi:uncharacterized protein ARMOST_00022 [Armillaria ostoyae]|uniref:Uncharacterized protein n=1 Tax=Armillaria ostoyae TaxID=47428 RepID=A0A284QJZ7_ARMOS|nr:uncharacterized protein ARMOST_00022 [Armillaria ostoyae]